jgi:preprotein translocase subunit YajC
MSPNSLSTLGLIALMAVAFYFLILRPQRKRTQAQKETMNSLVPGTRVMTGSGLFGTIVRIGDKQAVLEISPGVELTVLKQAIARATNDADEDPDDDDDDESDDEFLDEQVVEPELVTTDPVPTYERSALEPDQASDPGPSYEQPSYERPATSSAAVHDASGTDSKSAKE